MEQAGKTKQWPAARALAPWLLPAAVYALVWLVFGVRYEVNDDATLANIAAGAYGPDSQYLVYINIAVGWLIKPLYLLAPGLNWLYVLQAALDVAALGVLTHLFCEKWGARRGLLCGLIVLMLAGVDAFYSFQYVKNSGLYLIAGIDIRIEGLGSWNRKTVGGILWAVLGFLVRGQMFAAVGALAAPLLLARFFALDGAGKRRAAAAMAFLFAAVAAFWAADALAYRTDEGWQAFRTYNAVRTELSDFRLQYAGPQDMAPFGYSDNDLDMMNSWSYWTARCSAASSWRRWRPPCPATIPCAP